MSSRLFTQRLPEAGVVKQNVLHPVLHRGRVQRLRAHRGVSVQRAHDRVHEFGLEVG